MIFSSIVQTNEITLNGIKEKKFTSTGLDYIIKADKKTIDYLKLRKIHLFNMKEIMSQALYYNNGSFYQKQIKVDFERAYFYEGNFYMQNCFSNTETGSIKAKSAIYKKKYIDFKDLVLEKENKKYHKFKYRIDLN